MSQERAAETLERLVNIAHANGVTDRGTALHIVLDAYGNTDNNLDTVPFFLALVENITRRAQDQARLTA